MNNLIIVRIMYLTLKISKEKNILFEIFFFESMIKDVLMYNNLTQKLHNRGIFVTFHQFLVSFSGIDFIQIGPKI